MAGAFTAKTKEGEKAAWAVARWHLIFCTTLHRHQRLFAMRSRIAFCVLASLPLLAARGQAGLLDPTFGNGGIVVTAFPAAHAIANAIAVDASDRILVAGTVDDNVSADLLIARYLPNGALDPTFGSGGITITDVNGSWDEVFAMVLQPDGFPIVAGITVLNNDLNVVLARFNLSGALDPTFGNGGIVVTGVNATDEEAFDIALAGDGIVVCGETGVFPLSDFMLVRYDLSGNVDPTFGTNGVATADFNGQCDFGFEMVVQPDERIVVAGFTYPIGDDNDDDVAVARFHGNGAIDASFGTMGKVVVQKLDTALQATGLALQPDGKILLGVRYYNLPTADMEMMRLLPNGALDPSFGVGGSAVNAFGPLADEVQAIELQPDGRVLAVGQTIVPPLNADIALWRAESNGLPDMTFGTGGNVFTDTSAIDHGETVCLQPDGKILVGGYHNGNAYNELLLVRYGNNMNIGVEEGTLGAGPVQVLPNPTTGDALLTFTLANAQPLSADLFDARGRKVRTVLPMAVRAAGPHRIPVELSDVPAGLYTVVLGTADHRIAVRVVKH